MAVDYMATGDSFTSGKPRLLSDKQLQSISGVLNYDVAPDGKRLAVLPVQDAPAGDTGNARVTFLLNFFDELRRKVPAGK